MFRLYGLLFGLGALLAAPYYVWRYRKSASLRRSWRERFGYLPESFQQPEKSGKGSIWIHAVSVGETIAVSTLARELQRRHPDRKIFISHVTPTGRETSEKRMQGLAGRLYLPLDFKGSVQRTLGRLRPALLLIVETELWPNLLRWSHESGARVVLVNARLSQQSLQGYRRFRFFMRRVFQHVDWVFAQTPADAARFCQIGARPDRVVTLGNLKFDVQPPEYTGLSKSWKRAIAATGRGPVLIAASTMSGEEAKVLAAWNEIHLRLPRAIMILAPRHPARFDEAAGLLRAAAIRFLRRSELPVNEPDLCLRLASCDVVLLDSIGELAGLFALADLVFMGGSLVPTGGHNVLEPARFGKPVIFGPYMSNFPDVARLFLDYGAAVQVRDESELSREAIEMLEDIPRRRAVGEAGRKLIEQGSGATQRILERITELLDEPDVRAKQAAGDKSQ
ncbi:MAG: 3-deoxy-D-manno-octulosonic acid transferase [Terriglobia bacterium]